MPPETRKYTRNKTTSAVPPVPALPSFITESIEPDDDGGESGVTYYVDENGRYYFQPNSSDTGIVALDPATVEQETQPQAIENLIVPENYTQTVTLVPSENPNGEVSYVLVVTDENKDMPNLNIKIDADEPEQMELDKDNIQEEGVGAEEAEDGGDEEESDDSDDEDKQDDAADVYTFEDDEEPDGSDVETPVERPRKRRQSRALFTCNFCSYNSHRRYLLLRHMKCHSEDRPYKCAVCDRGFKTQASLQNHVNMHNGVKPHTCKFCKSTFTTSGELVRHVRYKHTHEKPHKCTECDYASVELSKLRRHVRCHTGERPYQCPHCTYASPDTFKLKRHLRTHTGEKPYKCDMCTMCFTQSNSLKAHKLIHNVSQKPVYACELCPAKCGRKTDLRIHVQKLHTSEQPLKCKRCGKSFPDRYSCKVHNKTHEGEKCYKCDLCPYASTTMRHLKSHVLKHTDEKPYACDHCDQSFRQKQLLRRHQNIYHNPDYVPKAPKEKSHTCHACHRTFAHKGNLMRHLAVHDPESGHHERALALKLGRQRKIQYIDTNKFKHPFLSEIKTEGESSDVKVGVNSSLKRGELLTVSDGDGQQYVVLEVITLEDGTQQQVAVVAPDFMQTQEINNAGDYGDEYGEEEVLEDNDDDEDEKKHNEQLRQQQLAAERSIKLEKEVDTCFGFDEMEEGEMEEIEVEGEQVEGEQMEEVEEEEEEEGEEELSDIQRASQKNADAVAAIDVSHLLFQEADDEQNEEEQVVYELV